MVRKVKYCVDPIKKHKKRITKYVRLAPTKIIQDSGGRLNEGSLLCKNCISMLEKDPNILLTYEENKEEMGKVQTKSTIVAKGDLKSLTSRKVREKLEKKFDLDFTSRKEEIDQILMAEVDDHTNSHSEEDEVSEEEVHSSRKKADSDSDAEIEDGDEKDDDDEYQPTKGGRKPKPGKKRKGQDDDDDSDDDWNKKKPAKKGPAAGGRGGGKKQSAFTKSFKLSPELADVVGSDVMPRHEVVKKLWAVIKERDLQDPKNKQYAICDDQLMKVFGIKRFRTFGMMKHLKDHFLEAA